MSDAVPPDLQVVQDAIAFATAALDGDAYLALEIGLHALELDHEEFLDALASTMSVLADVADEVGGDPEQALREVGLGIELAVLAELADAAPSARTPPPHIPHDVRPNQGGSDGQEEQDRP
jgi:hypothetical protein